MPSATNECLTTFSSGLPIPANSPKEEYILDNNGNVIAALNFSMVNNPVGIISASYYVNNREVRRSENVEYLDRNFYITTTNALTGPVYIKLFFRNSELQRLVDEPNDGVGDVSSINDLVITKANQHCGESSIPWTTVKFPQSNNGVLDASASFIEFFTVDVGSFFIHRAAGPISLEDLRSCPGPTTSLTVAALGAGYTYQWQVDDGNGFANLVNNGQYSGVSTTSLNINNGVNNIYGFRYRNVATIGSTTVTSNSKKITFNVSWTGGADTNWHNSANWDCGVIPDANTDVVIESKPNLPVINSNVSCRSIRVKPGASVTVVTGVQLTITGKE